MSAGSRPRNRVVTPILIAVAATVAVVVVAFLVPGHRAFAFQIYVLLLGVLISGTFVGAIAAATSPPRGPLPFDPALRPMAMRPPPPLRDLRNLDRLIDSSTARGIAFRARLRPRLQELARNRLSRHRVRLDDVDAARRLLGEEAWAVVRPELEPAEERFGPGIRPETLERLVTTLEGL
jgi:hypothetical protein